LSSLDLTNCLNVATLTRTLNSTILSYQPSLVVLTEYATSTAIFTATLPDQSASIVYIDPSTSYVTLNPSTVVVTLQQPVVTITPDPVTQVSTLDAQTSMVISDFEVTGTEYATLPQDTTYFTTDPLTDQATVTLPRDTTTSTISVTLPPLTETVTLLVTLPVETQTAIQSLNLPAVTQTVEVDTYLPDVIETLTATQTLIDIVAAPTITQTYSPPFILRIVGGFYDGSYVDATQSPYEDTADVLTVGSVDPEAATTFSIDPDSGALSTASGSFALTAEASGSSLIVSSSPYTLQMTCADAGGYLSCAGDGFTIFSVQDYGYLETPDYQSTYAPPFVGVQYQILYLPLAAAATTSSAAAASTITSVASTQTSSASVCGTSYEDTSVSPPDDYSISCTVDYPSGNLGRIVTSSLIECIQECSMNEECEAIVWFEQGQDQQWCYFKDANAVAQPAPFPSDVVGYSTTRSPAAAASTTTSALSAQTSSASVCPSSYQDTFVSPPDNYDISCTVNYGGNSINTLVTDTLVECIQYCSSTASCVAVVWVEQGQGSPYCYLKDANAATELAEVPSGFVIYSATNDPGATGAATDPTTSDECGTSYQDTTVSPPDGYSISCTTNYAGNSIRTLVTNTLIECIQYCSSTQSCVAVVWVQQGQDFPYCYLKDATAATELAEIPGGFIIYSAAQDQRLQ
jgi:hypothetical protein